MFSRVSHACRHGRPPPSLSASARRDETVRATGPCGARSAPNSQGGGPWCPRGPQPFALPMAAGRTVPLLSGSHRSLTLGNCLRAIVALLQSSTWTPRALQYSCELVPALSTSPYVACDAVSPASSCRPVLATPLSACSQFGGLLLCHFFYPALSPGASGELHSADSMRNPSWTPRSDAPLQATMTFPHS